nr:hypothetical protein [Lautropia sp.]
RAAVVKGLDWPGPVFSISALTGEGCRELCFAIGEYVLGMQAGETRAHDVRFDRDDPPADPSDEQPDGQPDEQPDGSPEGPEERPGAAA